MQRTTVFILFLIFYAFLDYYIFQAVKVVTQNWSSSTRTLVHSIYWILTFITYLSIVFWRSVDSDNALLKTIMFSSVALNFLGKFFAGIVLFSEDIYRAGKYLYAGVFQNGGGASAEGMSRSEFISKTALAVGTIPAATLSFGVISGAYDYRVRKREVKIANLPRAFDGVRIAQLSDIHSGSFFNKTAVKGGVEMMLAEKPDLFLFTGDLVNNESKEVKDYLEIFEKAKAPLGSFSVLGNHDYGDYKQWTSLEAKQQNLKDLIQSHKNMGWDILMNEHRYLEVDGERLAIVGVENWGDRGFAKYGKLKEAMHNVEADAKILLSHDPSHWDAQIRPNFSDIDLTLSGHTHGMQFGVEIGDFRWSPSQYIYKQWADLYTEGNQNLYVNRGFGFLGYPGRIGILPEITILELKKA
ncbi:metallophosphoesterase [Reichenbachiella versicolor]|uniref:metallophosphoesterase n=1 Tax=Reichenbachiella versicolor TaxID=1821036 RepID=UPI000D6E8AA6|nr:metallophosphoesterase [Reichenbachiella versicolor]